MPYLLFFRLTQHTHLTLRTNSQMPLLPASTVPFLRDPDFVDRPEIMAWIRDKCADSAARAALVGLGGVGYVTEQISICISDPSGTGWEEEKPAFN
jgi:hypothetical protein